MDYSYVRKKICSIIKSLQDFDDGSVISSESHISEVGLTEEEFVEALDIIEKEMNVSFPSDFRPCIMFDVFTYTYKLIEAKNP